MEGGGSVATPIPHADPRGGALACTLTDVHRIVSSEAALIKCEQNFGAERTLFFPNTYSQIFHHENSKNTCITLVQFLSFLDIVPD